MLYTAAALCWLEKVLAERYGFNLDLKEKLDSLELTLPGAEGSIIFDRLLPEFQQSRSDFSCGNWDPSSEGFVTALGDNLPAPGTTALPVPLIERKATSTVVHYDILGFTYWMLNRLEEVGRTDLDMHGRFCSTSSHAYQYGYLERPIIDEWLQVLGQVIQEVWPQVKLKQHQFSVKVSHDVDSPSRYGFRSFKSLMRAVVGDTIKHKNLKNALMGPWVRIASSRRLHISDPYNTFDWLMDVSESNNIQSAFYFICGRTDPAYDADYEPEYPAIRELIRRIHSRGHEVGLHPSYGTYKRPELIRYEAQRLKQICADERVYQQSWGGRMHYLRWEHPVTLQAWADAGMDYDSTLCYSDRPGFRCGTSFEYPAFNTLTQKVLDLRIRPLIAMESTVISSQYMGLGYSQAALDKFLQLKSNCRKVGGSFTILWHNSHFMTQRDFEFYQEIVAW